MSASAPAPARARGPRWTAHCGPRGPSCPPTAPAADRPSVSRPVPSVMAQASAGQRRPSPRRRLMTLTVEPAIIEAGPKAGDVVAVPVAALAQLGVAAAPEAVAAGRWCWDEVAAGERDASVRLII